jgi:hypothetical protein
MRKKKNYKKRVNLWMSLLVIGFLLFLPNLVFAQPIMNQGLGEFENVTGLQPTPLPILIGRIVKIILSFLGLIGLIIIIIGGFLWMTSGGVPEKISKAKKLIINGLIGLLIIVFAYAVVSFILKLLSGTISPPGGGGGGGGGGGQIPPGASYLVVISKYPKPNEKVPKNTSIVVTFNHNLDCETVKLCDNATTDCTVSILKNGEYIKGLLKVKNNTLIFKPDNPCPDPLSALACQESNSCLSNNTSTPCPVGTKNNPKCESLPSHEPPYTSLACCPSGAFCCNCFEEGGYNIKLKGGKNGIKALNGKYLKEDVSWSFMVENVVDNTPPEVIVNLPQGNSVPINTGIAVIFSKEIDPTTLLAYDTDVSNYTSATVQVLADNQPLKGFFEKITATSFIWRPKEKCPPPNDKCYCFPKNTNIRVILKNEAPPGVGIRDTHCNLLNCENKKCDWTFKTSNEIDTTPPNVTSTDPANNATNVSRDTDIKATFTEPMDPTSVNFDTFELIGETAQKIETDDNKKFSLKPFSILDAYKRYNVIIYGGGQPNGSCGTDPGLLWGVRDLAGNAMVDNYIWSFTTAGSVNNGNPYIDWVKPTSGPEGQCVTIHGYNLGCAVNWPNNPYARNGVWDNNLKRCRTSPSVIEGRVEFYTPFGWTTSTEILKWNEINRPDNPPSPYSPENEIIISVPKNATSSNIIKEIRVYPPRYE